MISNLDVFLWNRKVGSLVAYKERYTEKVCFYFDRDFLISRGDLLELAKRYNIKGVDTLMEKAVGVVSHRYSPFRRDVHAPSTQSAVTAMPPVSGCGVSCSSSLTHPHAVYDFIFLIVCVQTANRYIKIQRHGVAEPELVAVGDAAAHQVAMLAGCREFVVELSGLVQRANIATFLLAEVPPHFGSHLPQRIAEVGVVPRP